MATFFGQVRGRAESYGTRLGTKTSGIESSVQSWEGSIITKMYYNEKNELMVNIETADGSNFCGQTIFNGTFEEYKKKLNS